MARPGESTPLTRLRSRGRLRGAVPLLGPAFVAAIAYVDPGNFATNIEGGTRFGFMLVWVIVVANLMAMLIQTLSARLGLVTQRNLAELCRDHFGAPARWGLWGQAELVAMATDLAEIVGGALALHLLFDIPLFPAGLITGMVSFGLLALLGRGYRQFELVIGGLLAVIVLGFLYDGLRVGIDVGGVASGLVPRLQGTESVLLAVGILGATVMPHAIWLHSALTTDRIPAVDEAERRHLLRYIRIDVLIAMSIAGLVNLAMLVIAASLFRDLPGEQITTIEGAYEGIASSVDRTAAIAFGLALLASGFASSGVGTYAGQVIMQGFLRRRIPVLLRRAVTMAPALVVLGLGLDPTRSLVISQVVLSFGIPFALVPLIMLSRRADIMGKHATSGPVTALAISVATMIIGLNGFLLGGLLGLA